MITDKATPHNEWKLVRIVYTKSGDDSLVRQVKLQTAHKVRVKPVTRLCFLEDLGTLSELSDYIMVYLPGWCFLL